MSNQRWKLYNSPSSHKPLNKFNMAAADAIIIFGANSVTLKYDPRFYFTQNWFLCMYVGIVYVILKYILIVSSYIRNIGKRTTWFCKIIWGSHRDGGRAGGATCQWAIISGVLGGRNEDDLFASEWYLAALRRAMKSGTRITGQLRQSTTSLHTWPITWDIKGCLCLFKHHSPKHTPDW